MKNDWFITIQNDLSECNINLSEEEITNMKKETFKTLVKQKIKLLSKEYLISLRNKHTKSKDLLLENNIKGYSISEQLTIEDKQLLFALKTRAVDVKTNYKSMYSNLQCRLCNSLEQEESEIHVMQCNKIISDESLKKPIETISYSDIFGNMKQQISAVKILKKIFKVCPPVDTRRTCFRARVPHIPALLLRMWILLPQMIVTALCMILDNNI